MSYQPGGKKDRQYGRIDEIRSDHVNRYLFAADRIKRGSTVLDAACGCGYGSWLLHGADLKVTSVDIEPEAIEYAKRFYQGPEYLCQRAEDTKGEFDVLVSFETLEHLENPKDFLLSVKAKQVIASVPNENLMPFDPDLFAEDKYPHRRHYTPEQFEELMESCGHPVQEKFCQQHKYGKVVPGTDGLFLIYVCA
jgi:hypothetical protein